VNEILERGEIYVPQGRWKLSSYEVAGFAPEKWMRPERTLESVGAFSTVLSGRILFLDG